jgi:hypothetical protein
MPMLCLHCNRQARKGKYCTLHYPKKCKCGNVSARECASCTKNKRRPKVHEMHMKDLLYTNGIEDFVHNKKLIGTNISPDFIWERETHFVILEVDEHGHKSYNPQKEEQRMKNISLNLKKMVVFVRLTMPCSTQTIDICLQIIQNALENNIHEIKHEEIKILSFFGGLQAGNSQHASTISNSSIDEKKE